jgi:AAA domain, putative AbiEii toxin, Type IV TA system
MLNSFHIKNYRGFKDFKIEPLERVNLITGSNNVGKTSLLEALYLNLAPGMAFISNLSPNKKQDEYTAIHLFRGFDAIRHGVDNESRWGWLFYAKDFTRTIEIISEDFMEHRSLSMYWLSGDIKLSSLKKLNLQTNPLPNLSMQVDFQDLGGSSFTWLIHKHGHQPPPAELILKALPLRVVAGDSSRPPEEDAKWFSKLDDLGRQDELLSTLRLLDSRLKNLAVSVADGVPMIYADIGIGRRIPLAVTGEGMMRLLSLILEITNASGGVMLVDEIENGLHHSVLTKVWRAIGEAARRSDTQVFATTHSWECIQAAHEAFLESDHYDLRLHRLDRVDGDIKAITYDQKTLDTSVEMNLEVR